MYRCSNIEVGYSVVRIYTNENGTRDVPVGIAAWDEGRRWWDLRVLKDDERVPGVKAEHRFLLQQADSQIRAHAEVGTVPYFGKKAKPWTCDFWCGVISTFESSVRLDAPRALTQFEDETVQFLALFDSVVLPTRSSERATRGYGALKKVLGKKVLAHTAYQIPFNAYGGAREQVTRAATNEKGSVIFEAINLAGNNSRRDADALVSKLRRIQEGNEERNIKFVIGYVASPGGLNGETHMRDWMRKMVTSDVYDVASEKKRLYDVARTKLAEIGISVRDQLPLEN